MGDDQRYSLRWNDFYSNVISAFKTLKESEDFVDVTIACDGKSLKAHRLILSAASPFFRKLLKDHHHHPHPIVILKDVRYQDMESLLSFMYLGEVQICQEDLTEFLRTAQTLQIKGLTDVPHIPRSPRSPSPSLTPPPPLHHIPEVRMDNLSDDPTSPTDSPPKAAKRLKTATNINGTTTTTGTATTGTGTGTTIIAGENGVGVGTGIGTGIGMDERENSHENHNHFNSNLHSHETNSDNTPDTANASGVEKNESCEPDRNSSSSPSNNDTNNKTIKSSSGSTANHHNDNGKLQDNEKRSLSVSNHTSILIQALEQGRHQNYERDRGGDENSIKHDSSHQSAMMIDDDSSPDEEDMKYDEKGMDGIESCDELSAHALSDAMSRFPAAAALAYGLQGSLGSLPAFLPAGPSNSMDVSRRSLELLRVRATDPRPCPKCGKIYRSAHTLRTHLEDKHTLCPGYRCVLCGTVAKSRNSLHSHMSRQHRGISTKDLPVLPMPAPFDPGLASRLLSKAGLKFPSHDMDTGTSPASARRSGGLEVTPVPSSEKNPAESPKSGRSGSHPATPKIDPGTTGSAILDTYLQFIAENSIALGGGLHYQRNPNAAPHHRSNNNSDKNQIHSSGEIGDDDESGEEDDS